MTFAQAGMLVEDEGDDNLRPRSGWLKMEEANEWYASSQLHLTVLRNQQSCRAKCFTKSCLSVCYIPEAQVRAKEKE